MNYTNLRLYELLGSKELSFGCLVKHRWTPDKDKEWEEQISRFIGIDGEFMILEWDLCVDQCEIIGHEPTILDLHRWFVKNRVLFKNSADVIVCENCPGGNGREVLIYNSSDKLISQSESSKNEIILLIESIKKCDENR